MELTSRSKLIFIWSQFETESDLNHYQFLRHEVKSIALLKSQQTFQQSFYSSVGHPVGLENLLKSPLKSLLRFQQSYGIAPQL